MPITLFGYFCVTCQVRFHLLFANRQEGFISLPALYRITQIRVQRRADKAAGLRDCQRWSHS